MFKPIRQNRKSKSILADKFVTEKSNFKAGSIVLSNQTVFFQAINKINQIAGIPNDNEDYRIVTRKNINSFDFILLLLHKNKITDLTIAFYRIGKKVIQELKNLKDNKLITNITLLVNDGFPKLCPDAYNLMKQYESSTFKIKIENNHTKIICAKTEDNKHYVIEGSGNLSNNSRIEQYSFTQNKSLYDFHTEWINNI